MATYAIPTMAGAAPDLIADDPNANALAGILRGPLPSLPRGDSRQMAREVRQMRSSASRDLWRHPTWCRLIVWIQREVPECDPIAPALWSLRTMNRMGSTGEVDYRRMAVCLRRGAERYRNFRPDYRWARFSDRLAEMAEQPPPIPCSSLEPELRQLLRAAGILCSPATFDSLAAAVDVAVDWLDQVAEATGLKGDDLIAAARQPAQIHSGMRLQNFFAGPAARPLVALLLGGDVSGWHARRASGSESGIVFWALACRHARTEGLEPPRPPQPVARMWATMVGLVEMAITDADQPVLVAPRALAA